MRIAPILVCGLLGTATFSAGQQTAPETQTPTIRLNVNLVQLNVTATDSSGRTISGLGQQAFQLFVDDVQQPITVFHGEDAPVSAGIVIDNSASMESKRSEVVAAALAFARASNPQDQMFVVHFNDQVRLGLPPDKPFTSDVSELEAAISRFSLGGSTALYDALALAQSQFRKAVFTRKVLLIITDGGDNSSRIPLKDVLNGAITGGIVMYCIGLFDETDRDRSPRVLTQLSEVTGGEAFFPPNVTDTTNIAVQIARVIRRQYTLGFAGGEDGKYHRIKVTVHDPKAGTLKAHTRAGYFAVKP
jgi:Ca-activated chloride channel family protein